MNQTIKTLLEIQEIDKLVHKLKENIRTMDAGVKTKENVIKILIKELEEIDAKIDTLKEDREYNEQLVEDKNDQIKALNNKSSLIKNTKEQKALEVEMSMANTSVEKIEDQIVSLLSDIDTYIEKKDAKQKEVDSLKAEYELLSKTTDKEIKKITGAINNYLKKRSGLFNNIDDATTTQYEEINRWAEGNVMSEIKSESCMGCFLMLPPQVSATVMETEQLVFCPNCGRILYIYDES